MARILYLFEKKGVRNLVLGSFGTGVFRNDVDAIAQIWADLLSGPSARFGKSFDRVMFAIMGRQTFVEFEEMNAGIECAVIGNTLVFIVHVGLRVGQHRTMLLFGSNEIKESAAFRSHLKRRHLRKTTWQ